MGIGYSKFVRSISSRPSAGPKTSKKLRLQKTRDLQAQFLERGLGSKSAFGRVTGSVAGEQYLGDVHRPIFRQIEEPFDPATLADVVGN